jgi:hypothetical protein
MRQVRQIDLHANELFQRNPDTVKPTVKPWVEAETSSHVWKADLPDNLSPGAYTVSVWASDAFGRPHHAPKVLEITGTASASVSSGGAFHDQGRPDPHRFCSNPGGDASSRRFQGDGVWSYSNCMTGSPLALYFRYT